MSSAPPAATDNLLHDKREINVLMIDDDPEFCNLIADGLEANDEILCVETTSSPASGLDIVNERPPDCVVSDYDMPEMDGIQLLETLRRDHAKVPFILYTSKGDETVASEAITAGATDYLSKGYGSEHYDHLSTLIQAIVKEHREKQLQEKKEEMIRLAEVASNAGGFEINIPEETLLITEGALRILDPAKEDILAKKGLAELFDVDVQVDIKQTAERMLSTGNNESTTVTYQRADSDRRVLKLTFMPTAAGGIPTAVRGVIRDITDQRQKQQQIEVFDRVLRHNLRNDLNLIRGTAETIESKTSGEIANHSEQIIEKGDRLLKTVSVQRDIMETLRMDPEYKDINIERVLQQVASNMGQRYSQAEVTVECPADLSVEASSQFTRAIEELVQNAIEHNDDRPPIVQLAAEPTDHAIRVQIIDNGPAIPEMEREVLVEPEERTSLYHGSGLGLWFVKLIIFRSNGEIMFDKNEPNGNIITTTIPK